MFVEVCYYLNRGPMHGQHCNPFSNCLIVHTAVRWTCLLNHFPSKRNEVKVTELQKVYHYN